jgi:hypothetical protein
MPFPFSRLTAVSTTSPPRPAVSAESPVGQWAHQRRVSARRISLILTYVLGLLLVGGTLVGVKHTPPYWDLAVAVSAIAWVFSLGAWGQAARTTRLLVQPRPRSPSAGGRPLPRVRAYGSLDEGRQAGWQFFGICGHYRNAPIPQWALLQGEWSSFAGLRALSAPLQATEHAFGDLVYLVQAETPAQPGELLSGQPLPV